MCACTYRYADTYVTKLNFWIPKQVSQVFCTTSANDSGRPPTYSQPPLPLSPEPSSQAFLTCKSSAIRLTSRAVRTIFGAPPSQLRGRSSRDKYGKQKDIRTMIRISESKTITCIYIHIHACTYIYMYIYIYNRYIYIDIYVYIYIYLDTQRQRSRRNLAGGAHPALLARGHLAGEAWALELTYPSKGFIQYPEGPSTQYLRTLVPKAIHGMVF